MAETLAVTRPRRRLVASLAAGLAALALAWTAGFVWFAHAAWTAGAEPPPYADGIVALTGGAERIETALKLLAEDRARLLLVSGVGGGVEFSPLAHRAGVDPALSDRVTLGRTAASTRGNAAETADWVRANGVGSLIVVTASYHMPRALAELGRTLPGVDLHPVPVVSPALRQPGLGALRLLAGEYTKWLAAEAGLSGLAPRPGTLPAAREERHGG
jgi:uncharacterized SAM-binding protein YcdF (DUF218 family)